MSANSTRSRLRRQIPWAHPLTRCQPPLRMKSCRLKCRFVRCLLGSSRSLCCQSTTLPLTACEKPTRRSPLCCRHACAASLCRRDLWLQHHRHRLRHRHRRRRRHHHHHHRLRRRTPPPKSKAPSHNQLTSARVRQQRRLPVRLPQRRQQQSTARQRVDLAVHRRRSRCSKRRRRYRRTYKIGQSCGRQGR